jgi:anti-sigma B factor antagonist
VKYQFTITSDIIDSIPVIFIEGDLTSEADSDVKKLYYDFKDKGFTKKIIINFDKTKYINSSGIATLINIIQDVNENKGLVAFVGLTDHLQKVMDIVGISDFVQIYKNNVEAIKSL